MRRLPNIVKLAAIAGAVLFGLLVPSRAFAADYVIYSDAQLPLQYGGNANSPSGDPMAYFIYAELNSFYFQTENTSPSPQGSYHIRGDIGNVAYGGVGAAFITSLSNGTQVTKDMSSYAGGKIHFYLKSDRALDVEIQYDNGAGGNVSSASKTVASTGSSWQLIELDITAANFGSSVDYTKIKVPFLIKAPASPGSATAFFVDDIRWVANAPSTPVIRPSSTRVNPGKRRMFFIDQTAALTVSPSNLGSLSTASGSQVTVTANSTIQNGTLNATANSLTGTAAITVTNANIDQEFAILSAESIPTGVALGTDSNVFPYADSLGGTITLTNVTNDFRDGTFSVLSTVTVPSGGYAGFAVQALSSDFNMNEYLDGSIRFWFKADSTLSGKMSVSIRSSNVSGGSEHVEWLQNWTTFDNLWHPVVIPVDRFAGASPYTDLSRVAVLFNVGISSPTSGARAFYLDRVRWDTRKPGALHHIVVTPASVTIPKNLKQTFVAQGQDVNNIPVDIWPSWVVGTLGTLNRTLGDSVLLTAAASPTSGNLTATDSSISGSASVTVSNVSFTQSYNVYSDIGAGGFLGTDFCGSCTGTAINLNEYNAPGTPEGVKVMRAVYTLVGTTAYANWYVVEGSGSRFMSAYSQGYLHFWVRTNKDLEISIASINLNPSTHLAKIMLSSLGVPLDNTWQEVWLSLNDFKLKEAQLDFSQINNYFAITAIASKIGQQPTAQAFEVDDVKWYTADPHVPDPNKVYIGLKNKQSATTGLVVTYDNDNTNRAETYDQALAAMAYTFKQDTALAKKVLDVYKGKYDTAVSGSGFVGFNNEYDRDTPSTIRDYDRVAGPNAWIMLAAIHYRCATNSTIYDPMINGLGTWLKSLQDTDGSIKFGFTGVSGTPATYKSTEQNFDVYSAFKAWYSITGNSSYNTSANSLYGWLVSADTNTTVGAYNFSQARFNVGKLSSGARNNDYALDPYSWAPLALNGYESVLDQAETLFVSTHAASVSGLVVNGFDFSGTPGNGSSIPYGVVPDKDAVWLEGTGQMAVAYLVAGRQSKADQYINELDKAVFDTANGGQGLTYATNAGTAYWTGSLMDSTHAAISSMAWYLYAKWGFNPMQPLPLFDVAVKNVSNNVVASTITWSVNVPARWTLASQYIQVRTQGINTRNWGVQIYTDNTNVALTPHYQVAAPGDAGDPAGLLETLSGETTTHYKVLVAWRVVDSTGPTPGIGRPYDVNLGNENVNSPSWFYFQDRATAGFTDGMDYARIKSYQGLHTDQSHYFQTFSPDYIFFEADFGTAAAQTLYKTIFTLEFFFE